MANFIEVNDFVCKHTGAKYFDADLKLYKKHFPNSRILAELEKAPDYAKKDLDERIIYELLNNQDSCIDCIWENRGFVRNAKNELVQLSSLKNNEDSGSKKDTKENIYNAELLNELLESDIDTLNYNDLKNMVFGLKLDSKCINYKKATYLQVLTELKNQLLHTSDETINNSTNPGNVIPDPAKEGAGTEKQKKKEVPE